MVVAHKLHNVSHVSWKPHGSGKAAAKAGASTRTQACGRFPMTTRHAGTTEAFRASGGSGFGEILELALRFQ